MRLLALVLAFTMSVLALHIHPRPPAYMRRPRAASLRKLGCPKRQAACEGRLTGLAAVRPALRTRSTAAPQHIRHKAPSGDI